MSANFLDRMGLTDRVVLITGAGAGIGRATAHAFRVAGARVAVTDADLDAAEAVCSEIMADSGTASAVRLDASSEASIEEGMAETIALFGGIDILVNNAGLGARVPALELPAHRWREVLAIGLDGTFFCSRAAGRRMASQGKGSIVNVASIMGLCGGGLYPNVAYHAAKGAIINVTRALAVEWASMGVRVNAVAPEFVRTHLTEVLLSDPEMERTILDLTPLGRLTLAEEVADAIVFLASDLAKMITGHTLPIDGGWLAR